MFHKKKVSGKLQPSTFLPTALLRRGLCKGNIDSTYCSLCLVFLNSQQCLKYKNSLVCCRLEKMDLLRKRGLFLKADPLIERSFFLCAFSNPSKVRYFFRRRSKRLPIKCGASFACCCYCTTMQLGTDLLDSCAFLTSFGEMHFQRRITSPLLYLFSIFIFFRHGFRLLLPIQSDCWSLEALLCNFS